jgi:hypothetical protein
MQKIQISLDDLRSLLMEQQKICAEKAAMILTNSELRQCIVEQKGGEGDIMRAALPKCRFPDDYNTLVRYLQ